MIFMAPQVFAKPITKVVHTTVTDLQTTGSEALIVALESSIPWTVNPLQPWTTNTVAIVEKDGGCAPLPNHITINRKLPNHVEASIDFWQLVINGQVFRVEKPNWTSPASAALFCQADEKGLLAYLFDSANVVNANGVNVDLRKLAYPNYDGGNAILSESANNAATDDDKSAIMIANAKLKGIFVTFVPMTSSNFFPASTMTAPSMLGVKSYNFDEAIGARTKIFYNQDMTFVVLFTTAPAISMAELDLNATAATFPAPAGNLPEQVGLVNEAKGLPYLEPESIFTRDDLNLNPAPGSIVENYGCFPCPGMAQVNAVAPQNSTMTTVAPSTALAATTVGTDYLVILGNFYNSQGARLVLTQRLVQQVNNQIMASSNSQGMKGVATTKTGVFQAIGYLVFMDSNGNIGIMSVATNSASSALNELEAQ